MTTRLSARLVRVVQKPLAAAGLQIVKWPKLSGPQPTLPGGAGRFFPIGQHQPWRVPVELAENPRPFARVLTAIYSEPVSWPSSIAPEGGSLLYWLIRNIGPSRIIETGTCLGVSTIWMAAALEANGQDATLVSYDLFVPPNDPANAHHQLFQRPKAQVDERLEASSLRHRVVLREGDSARNLAEDREDHRRAGGVQFAFIDGDHSPRGVLGDFREVEQVLQVGGFVLLHDVYPDVSSQVGPRWLLDEGMRELAGTYEQCDLYLAQVNYGMTLLRRTS